MFVVLNYKLVFNWSVVVNVIVIVVPVELNEPPYVEPFNDCTIVGLVAFRVTELGNINLIVDIFGVNPVITQSY